MNNSNAKFVFARNADAPSPVRSLPAARDASHLFQPQNSDAVHVFIKKVVRLFHL
jgi:hypothetical protein